ncbi:hypothetical protein, partial [Escherichia coli]|uniref:hypothetical protein n=1 Tax=Escherichia coli TaxID=562 RepID=UPI00194E983A
RDLILQLSKSSIYSTKPDYVRNSTRISRIFRIKSGENITSALKLNSHNRLPGIYNPKDIVSILIGSYQSQSL